MQNDNLKDFQGATLVFNQKFTFPLQDQTDLRDKNDEICLSLSLFWTVLWFVWLVKSFH